MKWVWKGSEMMEALLPYYRELESITQSSFVHEDPIYRIFATLEEQNNWYALSDDPIFKPYLETPVHSHVPEGIQAPFGLGKVLGTGWIETETMLDALRKWLGENIHTETFQYDQLEVDSDYVTYKNKVFSKIIFCEGHRASTENPWFKYLPFRTTKGEVMYVKNPQHEIDNILHKGQFLLPRKNGLYKIGATYNWNEKNEEVTSAMKEELMENLQMISPQEWEVHSQEAGIRPNVADRRPLLGQHPGERPLYIFNGLGSRGVLMTPWLSQIFLDFVLDGVELPPEANIQRFNKRYRSSLVEGS
ncbi:MAG: FAD-dependent oxidoreductase [Schleiferiaceae bacterium]